MIPALQLQLQLLQQLQQSLLLPLRLFHQLPHHHHLRLLQILVQIIGQQHLLSEVNIYEFQT